MVERLGDRLLVGYNWRFHPNIRKVKELLDQGAIGLVYKAHAEFGYYLPYWRPNRDIHDVENLGIILEASHELDYLLWMFGPVESEMCVKAEIGGFGLGVEDEAEIILNFKSGVMASVSLDMLNKKYARNLHIIGEKDVIDWDYWTMPRVDVNESYVEEMKHFIRVVEGKEKPLVTAKEALEVLELAERLKACSS
jgi:predicted dehydrogenase